MRNARLEEAQAGIRIAGRNINNLRYADTPLCVPGQKRKETGVVSLASLNSPSNRNATTIQNNCSKGRLE